jgi:hypothetical protein
VATENLPGGLIEITPATKYETVECRNELRFVEREIDGRKVRILQQVYVITTHGIGGRLSLPSPIIGSRLEWRDVPLVTE